MQSSGLKEFTMDQQPQNQQLPNQPPREPSRHERSRPRHRSHNSWWGGLALIVVGLIFLLQNMTGFQWDNWWALFLLIPLVGMLWSAWDTYQRDGRFTRHLTGRLIGSAYLLVVFLAAISGGWAVIWPLFIIVAGLGTLLYRSVPE
jgi:cation transport ATPase